MKSFRSSLSFKAVGALFALSLFAGCGTKEHLDPLHTHQTIKWEQLEAWDITTVAVLNALQKSPIEDVAKEVLAPWRSAGDAFLAAEMPPHVLRPLLVQDELETARSLWTAATAETFSSADALRAFAEKIHESIEELSEHAGLVHEH